MTLTAVIDDDPSVCKALRRLLRSARMEVEVYESGESFLFSTMKREPDCLVLDIRMTGMSGPELRDRLVTMGRHIPVVFITAHAESGGISGAEVLRKPFGDEELLAAIQRAIRKKGGAR